MQHHETTTISPNGIKGIFNDAPDRADSIAAELENHSVKIASLLTSYHWHEKGIVHGLKIEPESVKIDVEGKGSFLVKYGINIHFGCSDVDIELDNKMRIGIVLDMQSGNAVLSGEFIPEREPDF